METPIIYNGVPWFDDERHTVNAHGASIIEDGGRYWLIGERKTDDGNGFGGFACYSSDDLAHWHFERIILAPQTEETSLLGPRRIGSRAKVLRNPNTGKYVLLARTDNKKHTDPITCVAVSDTINGEYQLLGAFEYEEAPLRKGDLGLFQEEDGTAYAVFCEGDIYRLSDDYTSAAELVVKGMAPGSSSPVLTKIDGTYFALFSGKTAWDSNENYYYSAPQISGPWTAQGTFAPEGTRTWNSQCSYVFPLKVANGSTVPVYIGDRWSYPHQASAASLVMLPLAVSGTSLSIPEYWPAWDPRSASQVLLSGHLIPAKLNSNHVGEEIRLPFDIDGEGRVVILGSSSCHGGYANVEITDSRGIPVLSQPFTFYAPTRYNGAMFIGPLLGTGDYQLSVRVLDEGSVFHAKDGTKLGSEDTKVVVSGVRTLNSTDYR